MSKVISAAATGLPEASRRQLMLGGAAAALLSAVPAAKAAATDISNPDEELIALGVHRCDLLAQLETINEKVSETHDEFVRLLVSYPEEMAYRKGDYFFFGNANVWKEGMTWTPSQVNRITDDGPYLIHGHGPATKARRNARLAELQASAAAHRKRVDDFSKSSGRTDLIKQSEILGAELDRVEARMVDMPAHTMEGVVEKLRIIDHYAPDSDLKEMDYEHEMVRRVVNNLLQTITGEA